MGEVHQLVATDAFSLQAAGRLVTKIFAPWVQDLALLVESVEAVRPAGALPDWQPGAVVRMPFSKKICCDGKTVSSQALTALADPTTQQYQQRLGCEIPEAQKAFLQDRILESLIREALLTEAIEQLLAGDVETGKAVLRDYINATVGFEKLAKATGTPSKSLMRMLGPAGNPRADNLFEVVCFLQQREGVRFHVRTAPV